MYSILRSPPLTVCISAEGAELHSIKDTKGTEFMWQADPAVWPRHAPVLFPIVGKLKDNSYQYEGQSYSLGQHGFARDRRFEVKEYSESSCTFELCSDEVSKQNFPFDFMLQITYQLERNRLNTVYHIHNPSSSQHLPFSIGAHPGFRCPIGDTESFEDYYLEFDKTMLATTALSDGLRSSEKVSLELPSKRLFLSDALFDKDALVFEQSQIERIRLASAKSGHQVLMWCENWPYFGIWSKKKCRDFVCLEPWYGIADHIHTGQDLLAKEGIIQLEAGKHFSCSFSVEFQ